MQINWFSRKFELGHQQNILPAIIERLEGTPLRIQPKIQSLTRDRLELKPNGKWSILEQIGHLDDLEILWQGRLEDILNAQKTLREADLTNTKTNNAGHNQKDLTHLIESFHQKRLATISMLRVIDSRMIFKTALHPRLEVPMNVIDLFSFVADHDDHHLAKIHELVFLSQNGYVD